MVTEIADCVVRFSPHNIEVKVPKGSTILEATLRAGIGVRSVCGGKGLCGKCKVIVKRGRFETRKAIS
jgi:Uncharacterized metal-binding protein